MCDLDLQPTIFFHKESKSKRKDFLWGFGGGGGGQDEGGIGEG